jgi:hypothetical protein
MDLTRSLSARNRIGLDRGTVSRLRAPARRMSAGVLLLFVLAAAGGRSPTVADDLVLCTTRDGKQYAGDTPPPGCVATAPRTTAAAPATSGPAVETPRARAAETRDAEIDRRRRVRAITLQSIVNRAYSNGRFLQGTVANGADFPVYGVRICVDSGNTCRSMTPPTLDPGARGAFSFPTNLLGVPDWVIAWDVVPHAGE